MAVTRAELTLASENFIRDCLKKRLGKRLGEPLPVYLYGSRARGDAAWHADYDLWIDAEVSPATLAAIREEIEESFVPFAVDLVTTRQLTGDFGARVRREARPW